MGARVVGAEAVASLDRPLSVSTGPSSDMALETCAEAGGKAHKRKVRRAKAAKIGGKLCFSNMHWAGSSISYF